MKNLFPCANRQIVCVLLSLILCGLQNAASASGGAMHLYVSQLALDHFVQTPELKQILQQERGILLSSSWYPDGGYQVDNLAPSDGKYGELSHWGGFTQAYLDHILLRKSPQDGDYAKQVATLLGVASHQLEDQLVDNTFLRLLEEADGHWQDEGDTGFDVLLLADKNPNYTTNWSWPRGDLVDTYDDMGLNTFFLNSRISTASTLLAAALIGERALLVNLGKYRESLAWGQHEYLAGAHGAWQRAYHIAQYWEALWLRLQNKPAPFIATTIPDQNGWSLSGESRSVASRLYVVFGRELTPNSINQESLRVYNAAGQRIAGRVERYGGPQQNPNLLWFQPHQDLNANNTYRFVVDKNLRDGYGVKLAEDTNGADVERLFTVPVVDQRQALPLERAMAIAALGYVAETVRIRGRDCQINPAKIDWFDAAQRIRFEGSFTCDVQVQYEGEATAAGLNAQHCSDNGGQNGELCRLLIEEIAQRSFATDLRRGLIDGVTYQLRPRHAVQQCADVEGYSLNAGTNLSQYDCHGKRNQLFRAQQLDDGSFALVNVASGMCIDKASANHLGANLTQQPCHLTQNQRWQAEAYEGPFYILRNPETDTVIEIAGHQNPANGANIQTWSFDGSEDMQWLLVPANGTLNFESRNFPGHFFSSRDDASVRLDGVEGRPTKEAAYSIVPGLADENCVSFQSARDPNRYLRHSGYWIWEHQNNPSNGFKQDATFCVKASLAGDAQYRSFESFNFPGHFIRHSGGRLRIDAQRDTETFINDASWAYRLP
ncbi:Extracellular exo-alpha-(1-_5)-L-arabinofuranosidase [Thalassocella blandensis]|nr:Extracellular exo-alpha-(1->5)-L-arabinofuranosidase [Thalassocella blandensis]